MPTSKGKQWAKDNGDMIFFETSALHGDQVQEAFTLLASAALKQNLGNKTNLRTASNTVTLM